MKKYFYVLRPILAIKWIEQGYGVAPTSFEVLMEQILPEGVLKNEIKGLIAQKSMIAELDYGDRIPVISEFIEAELARLEENSQQYVSTPAPVEIWTNYLGGYSMRHRTNVEEETKMIPIKRLKEILHELPEDALAYAYEGEVVGIIFVSADNKELGYIPTRETGSSDREFVKTIYKNDSL